MSGLQRFNRLLLRLQFLVWFQKSLRMLVRSLWFAGAAYLLIWGLNRLVGILPEASSRWTVIVLLGILPLLRIPVLWPKLGAFTWRLDRQLGLQEQVSTAFQEVSRVHPDPIIPDLLDQAVRELKRAYRKVILKGWGLLPDLASLILVLFLLGGIYYTAGFSMNTGQPPPADPQPAGRDLRLRGGGAGTLLGGGDLPLHDPGGEGGLAGAGAGGRRPLDAGGARRRQPGRRSQAAWVPAGGTPRVRFSASVIPSGAFMTTAATGHSRAQKPQARQAGRLSSKG